MTLQVLSSIVIAVFVHPISSRLGFNSILWAFCMYLESISVLPQLRVMQNAKVQKKKFFIGSSLFLKLSFEDKLLLSSLLLQMVEPFTAHYVFALGVARFLGCAHWILRVWGVLFVLRLKEKLINFGFCD